MVVLHAVYSIKMLHSRAVTSFQICGYKRPSKFPLPNRGKNLSGCDVSPEWPILWANTNDSSQKEAQIVILFARRARLCTDAQGGHLETCFTSAAVLLCP
jgi:hypothetical protein